VLEFHQLGPNKKSKLFDQHAFAGSGVSRLHSQELASPKRLCPRRVRRPKTLEVVPGIDVGLADHDWSLEEVARFLEQNSDPV